MLKKKKITSVVVFGSIVIGVEWCGAWILMREGTVTHTHIHTQTKADTHIQYTDKIGSFVAGLSKNSPVSAEEMQSDVCM